MSSRALLVRLDVQHGKDAEVEAFLTSALTQVRAEPATLAWFGVRFGKGDYGIFDAFPDDAGRQAHLTGAVAQALMARADSLLAYRLGTCSPTSCPRPDLPSRSPRDCC